MLARTTWIVLALLAVITFADWFSSPVQLCELPVQQHSENSKSYEGVKEYCSTGRIVVFRRATGRLIDSWHDDLTAAATIVIAIFTTILGVFTVSLARSTRIAANAADLSARAAIASQLPIMRIEPHVLGHGMHASGSAYNHVCAIHFLTFFNRGPTRAFPTEVQCGWTIGSDLPPSPTASYFFVVCMLRRCRRNKDIVAGFG
jgi:hypothetical protein